MKIRLSATLRQQVEEAAKANNRTLNSEIVSRLERTFREDAEPGGATWIETAKQLAGKSDDDRWQDHERRIAALEKAIGKGGK